jgi:SAM-dependent methyltransferase
VKISTNKDFKLGAVRYLEKLTPGEIDFLFSKPFCLGSFQECASEFRDFANILTLLKLSYPRKILDVGCGPGWLSEYLARLGHFVTGIDICPGMIDIARERIRAFQYTLNRKPLQASFQIQDAESLDINGSFHVAICYDSLHHFQNKEKVLTNLFRALRDGGRLLIHEGATPFPGSSGRRHLKDIMSRYDTLEDPLTPAQVRRFLEASGFTGITRFHAVNKLSPHRNALLRYFERLLPSRHAAINIFLGKKPRKGTADSDDPDMLKAAMTILRAGKLHKPDEPVVIDVKVRNTGNALWLAEPQEWGGFVTLGGKLLDDQGKLITSALPRTCLPRRIPPGESVDLRMSFPAPSQPGNYRVCLDMIDEFITWFGDRGSRTPHIDIRVKALEQKPS